MVVKHFKKTSNKTEFVGIIGGGKAGKKADSSLPVGAYPPFIDKLTIIVVPASEQDAHQIYSAFFAVVDDKEVFQNAGMSGAKSGGFNVVKLISLGSIPHRPHLSIKHKDKKVERKRCCQATVPVAAARDRKRQFNLRTASPHTGCRGGSAFALEALTPTFFKVCNSFAENRKSATIFVHVGKPASGYRCSVGLFLACGAVGIRWYGSFETQSVVGRSNSADCSSGGTNSCRWTTIFSRDRLRY